MNNVQQPSNLRVEGGTVSNLGEGKVCDLDKSKILERICREPDMGLSVERRCSISRIGCLGVCHNA